MKKLLKQVNLASSKPYVFRGFHYQVQKPQAKLISCIEGEIYDIIVDLNKNSRTYSWRSFKEAREFARGLGLKGEKQWRVFAKSNKRPEDIPYAPDQVYKNYGWAGYSNFLGTVTDRKKQWRPFSEARAFVHTLGLRGFDEWRKYASSGQRPDDIPSSPENHYRDEGWAGHSDWTGYDARKRNAK